VTSLLHVTIKLLPGLQHHKLNAIICFNYFIHIRFFFNLRDTVDSMICWRFLNSGYVHSEWPHVGDLTIYCERLDNADGDDHCLDLYYMLVSERWVVCLCNEPMAVQSARHDSRLKFLPIT